MHVNHSGAPRLKLKLTNNLKHQCHSLTFNVSTLTNKTDATPQNQKLIKKIPLVS